MKIELSTEAFDFWHPKGHTTKVAKLGLPFFKSRRGKYVHRVKAIHQHWVDGKFSHSTVLVWCGNHFSHNKGFLMAKADTDELHCAVCEGKAIGAGMDGARVINDRAVMYSPRRER